MLEEFKSTDLVFIGRVIEIDTVTIPDSIFDFAVDELWYTFEVTLLYRGKWKQKTIRVQSGFTNADDCKYVFKMGQEYVVYANHPLRDNKRKNKSVFETTVCTNTDKATDFKIVESEGLRRS